MTADEGGRQERSDFPFLVEARGVLGIEDQRLRHTASKNYIGDRETLLRQGNVLA